LELFSVIYRDIVAEFLLLYPTLEEARIASELELQTFFRSHRSGSVKKNSERVRILKEAIPLTTDRAVIASNSLFVKSLAREIQVLNASLLEYERQIAELYATLPERELFDSLPSAGEISAPRLLAAMGADRSKFDSAEELACFLGIAPVTERSGNHNVVKWRYSCSKVLRQSFIDWTFLSLRTSFWAEELYKKLRAKGKTHPVAIRAIAFKWIRIIFRCWKDRTTYSEARYLKALQRSGSPITSLSS
jgi:transposase